MTDKAEMLSPCHVNKAHPQPVADLTIAMSHATGVTVQRLRDRVRIRSRRIGASARREGREGSHYKNSGPLSLVSPDHSRSMISWSLLNCQLPLIETYIAEAMPAPGPFDRNPHGLLKVPIL